MSWTVERFKHVRDTRPGTRADASDPDVDPDEVDPRNAIQRYLNQEGVADARVWATQRYIYVAVRKN